MRPLRRGRENVRNQTEEEYTMTAVEATTEGAARNKKSSPLGSGSTLRVWKKLITKSKETS